MLCTDWNLPETPRYKSSVSYLWYKSTCSYEIQGRNKTEKGLW